MKQSLEELRADILAWYREEGRSLPWRETRDPYRVLVSEIMLQQTQVDRVIEKYHEFLTAFPTVKALAQAPAGDVIKVWKGLGYNRRALFLQRSAQAVLERYNGDFPCDLAALKDLPGIGDYTARAVLSFAFEQKVPMMDTNHRKFYARIFSKGILIPDKELLVHAEQFIDPLTNREVHDFNQALMDLMTAVSRKEKDNFVEAFDIRYPLQKIEKKKKKQTPFRETDRYVRGRIIDLLREKQHIKKSTLSTHLNDVEESRLQRILDALAKDQLIEVKKDSILLPS